MEIQEFSSPREEFAPVGQEFASPAPEFSRPMPEHRTAPESHTAEEASAQGIPVRERKRHRISSLMLTSATVAAAGVVALAGIDLAVPGVDFFMPPSITLSDEQRAYTEALIAALDAQDLEQLQALERDPRLISLAREAASFMESIEHEDNKPVCKYTGEQDFYITGVSYYGGRLWQYQVEGQDRYLDLDIQYYTDDSYSDHYLSTHEYNGDHHSMVVSRDYITSRNGDGLISYLSVNEYLCTLVEDPVGGYLTAYTYEGSVLSRQYFEDGISYTQWESRGTTVNESLPVDGSEEFVLHPYLENGTRTITFFSPERGTEAFTFHVIDGVTQPADFAAVQRQDYGDSTYFRLVITRADGTTYTLASEPAESEEDFLYHTFHFN